MKHVKNFFLRGLMFGGFGPLIFGIVCMIISFNKEQVPFNGVEIFLGIFSTYLLGFVQAGVSVFKEVEKWSTVKSTGLHLLVLYVLYIGCYLLNSWIPFNWIVILIFTGAFMLTYVIVWIVVYLIVRKTTKDMNIKIN